MTVRALLDTHALLWWAIDDQRLSKKARTAISDDGNEILVSAASAWEIATKVRKGKLPGAEALSSDLPSYLVAQDFAPLSISVAQARRAGALPGPLLDPFDRMLIAQAQDLGVPIVGLDKAFDGYGIQRLW